MGGVLSDGNFEPSCLSGDSAGLHCQSAAPNGHADAARCTSLGQLSTIGFLYFSQQGDVYQKDIESFFKLRRSTVSSQLDTLEKKGLIQRVPVSHDARLKKLVLTEEGLRISGQVLLVLEQMNDFMIQGLSQEETVVLTNLLRKIEQNLSRIG